MANNDNAPIALRKEKRKASQMQTSGNNSSDLQAQTAQQPATSVENPSPDAPRRKKRVRASGVNIQTSTINKDNNKTLARSKSTPSLGRNATDRAVQNTPSKPIPSQPRPELEEVGPGSRSRRAMRRQGASAAQNEAHHQKTQLRKQAETIKKQSSEIRNLVQQLTAARVNEVRHPPEPRRESESRQLEARLRVARDRLASAPLEPVHRVVRIQDSTSQTANHTLNGHESGQQYANSYQVSQEPPLVESVLRHVHSFAQGLTEPHASPDNMEQSEELLRQQFVSTLQNVAATRERAEQLQSSLDDALSSCTTSREHVQGLSHQLRTTQNHLNEREEQVRHLERENEFREIDRARLSAALTNAQDNIDDLQRTIFRVEENHANAMKELKRRYNAAMSNVNARLQDRADENAHLEQQVDAANLGRLAAEHEQEVLQSTVHAKQKLVREYETQYEEERDARERDIASYNARLNASETELAELTEQVEGIRQYATNAILYMMHSTQHAAQVALAGFNAIPNIGIANPFPQLGNNGSAANGSVAASPTTSLATDVPAGGVGLSNGALALWGFNNGASSIGSVRSGSMGFDGSIGAAGRGRGMSRGTSTNRGSSRGFFSLRGLGRGNPGNAGNLPALRTVQSAHALMGPPPVDDDNDQPLPVMPDDQSRGSGGCERGRGRQNRPLAPLSNVMDTGSELHPDSGIEIPDESELPDAHDNTVNIQDTNPKSDAIMNDVLTSDGHIADD